MSQTNRKAIIRYNKRGATVLCNLGHLITFIPFDKDFAGSYSQMLLSFREDGDVFDRQANRCEGYGHVEGELLK